MGKNVKILNQSSSSFFRFFGGGVREFCEHTPIHGVPYTGQGGRTLKERVIWIVILVIATTSCCILIRSRYVRWEKTPVLVNLKEEPLNVWDVPMPAITICPDRLSLETLPESTKCLDEGADYITATFCQDMPNDEFHFNETGGCAPETAFGQIMRSFVPERGAVFFYAKERTSADIILTELGICYTLNSYDPSDVYTDEAMLDLIVLEKADLTRNMDWTLSKGYTNQNAKFPFRAFDSGYEESIVAVVFNSSASCDVSPSTGYTVTLHLPTEYPSLFSEPIKAAEGKASWIAVKPKYMFADEDVRSLPVDKRKCFFEDERSLRFFRFYTESNCDVECFTNYTYKTCGCVPPYMLRAKEMELCKNSTTLKCARGAWEALLTYEFNNRGIPGSCNCLSGCNSLVFEYSTVDTKMPDAWNTILQKVAQEEVGVGAMIYPSESLIWSTKRARFTTMIDFLADCGGLMGLCMGISIVSIIEILYHCTIRCVGRTLEEPEELQKEGDQKTRRQEDLEDGTELKPFTEN